MKCIDSDLLVAILRGNADAQSKMDELDTEGRNATTSINAFEIFYGAARSSKREKNLDEAKRMISRLEVMPLDIESANKAAVVAADLAEKGEQIDFRDVLVAGIALTNELSLVTKNARHFARIRNLTLESWP
jgi:predicted nucleic acid-binding protein